MTTAAIILICGALSVHDADTIRCNGKPVRLSSIDAPELAQPCYDTDGQAWACGMAARDALRQLVASKTVRCVITGTDRYRRSLGICYVEVMDLNAWLVAHGWAVAYMHPDYEPQQAYARGHRRGVWAGKFEMPASWRKRR